MLGLKLHLSPGKVKEIEQNNPRNCDAAFGQVIVEWTRMNYNHVDVGTPSWLLLVKIVDKLDHQLAKQIASNHQRYALVSCYRLGLNCKSLMISNY